MNSRLRVALAAAAVLAFGWGIAWRPLYNPDESRYAEIGREMVQSGDWIVPRVNGVPYLDKPPLCEWLIAAGIAVFGPRELAPRLVPFLAALAVALMLVWAGRAHGGEATGLWAATIWCSSVLPIALSRIVSTDMLLAAMTTASSFCFWRALEEGRRWAWAGWVFAALAFLTKGPVGFVIPFMGGVAYAIVNRGLAWRRLLPLVGVPLCLAIALSWFAAVQGQYPAFFRWFFLVQNLGGFATKAVHHPGNVLVPLGVTLGAVLPWTPALVALALLDRSVWKDRTVRFLALWVALLVAFFTLSVAKLIPYQLPIVPAVALLGGILVSRAADRRSAFGYLVMGLILAGGSVWIAVHGSVPGRWEPVRVGAAVPLAGAILAAGAFAGAALAWTRRPTAAGLCLAAGMIVGVVPALHAIRTQCDDNRSTRELIAAHRGEIGDLPVLMAGQTDYSAIYYLRRPVRYVGRPRELEFGATLEPSSDPSITHEEFAEMTRKQKVAILFDMSDVLPREGPFSRSVEIGRRGTYVLLISTP